MTDFNLAVFLSFALITNFTPGPNNISSASMGILHGYKKSWPYMAGISVGFFVIMILCGLISTLLLNALPSFEMILRIIGAIYILWLGYKNLRSTYSFDEKDQQVLGFTNGLLLQLLNPKVIVYGMTLYSSFLSSLTGNVLYLFFSALLLTMLSFSAISTWALFGSAIRTHLRQPRVRQALNLILSLLLVYTAIELSGLFSA